MSTECFSFLGGYFYSLAFCDDTFIPFRAFTEKQKRETFEKQKGVCPKCSNTFELSQMEADHITPWHLGGKSTAENCQMLCKNCNRIKSGI